MDDENRPTRRLAWLRAKFVHGDAACLGLQPMMACLGHEIGRAFDSAALIVSRLIDVWRAAEQLEGDTARETGRDTLTNAEHAPDDLQTK